MRWRVVGLVFVYKTFRVEWEVVFDGDGFKVCLISVKRTLN